MKDIGKTKNIMISLITKDLFGDYRNSFLGFGWHFAMPLVMMLVFYVVFLEVASSLEDFWIYICAGLFPFNYLVSNLVGGSGTIVSNSELIKKMYFPREIIVISKVISSFIILVLGYAAVLGIIAVYGHPLHFKYLLLLAVILVLMGFFALGYSLFFSSVTVYFRDIQHVLTSISMVFFFLTPMYFVPDQLTGVFSEIIWYNPFTYYVEACHYLVYYGTLPDSKIITTCIILPFISMTIGIIVFSILKRRFAERL